MPSRIAPSLRVAEEIGRLLGCRWSQALLTSVHAGTDRPGALLRAHAGLSEKVMRFCLSRMIESSVLEKVRLPGRVKGTSYKLTEFGHRLVAILDQIMEAARHAPPTRPDRGDDSLVCPPAS